MYVENTRKLEKAQLLVDIQSCQVILPVAALVQNQDQVEANENMNTNYTGNVTYIIYCNIYDTNNFHRKYRYNSNMTQLQVRLKNSALTKFKS